MMGQLFSFQGRTTRLGYLAVGFVQSMLLIALIVVFAVMVAAGLKNHNLGMLAVGGLILVAGGVMSVWMSLAVMARRLRDMGWPVGAGLAAILTLNLLNGVSSGAAVQAVMSGHMPTASAGHSLLTLITAAVSLVLLFWPSAKDKSEIDLDEVFGREDAEPAFQTPLTPSFSTPASNPAPQPRPRLTPDAPRTTFGLRGLT